MGAGWELGDSQRTIVPLEELDELDELEEDELLEELLEEDLPLEEEELLDDEELLEDELLLEEVLLEGPGLPLQPTKATTSVPLNNLNKLCWIPI